MLHKKIMDVLTHSKTLTQKGLAEFMGLDPAAVNRMLHGRRNIMAQEIPLIEKYLGQKITLTDPDYAQPSVNAPTGFSDVAPMRIEPLRMDIRSAELIPVFDDRMDRAHPLEWTPRHPRQLGLGDAFAFFVNDDAMQPRFERGNFVYIHPRKPVLVGQDCLIVPQTGHAFLARQQEEKSDTLVFKQWNTTPLKKMPKKDIQAVYLVIGVSF